MEPGSPRSPTFATPAPGLSCALAPVLPHQQELFLFPAVFSQQPLLGGDGAAGGEGGACEGQRGAVPLQGQAVPLLAGALAEIKSAKPHQSPKPILFLNWFVKAPPDRCWEGGFSLDTGGNTAYAEELRSLSRAQSPKARLPALVYYVDNLWGVAYLFCASVSYLSSGVITIGSW